MAECKNCIHQKVCKFADQNISVGTKVRETIHGCSDYKAIEDVVEVETIKAWLYEMAINNAGDFSNACEEIISRLYGLRKFAKERECDG